MEILPPSVIVMAIVAPRRQVCRGGGFSAMVGFACPHLSFPLSLPSVPPRLPSCGVPPPPLPPTPLNPPPPHVPLIDPPSATQERNCSSGEGGKDWVAGAGEGGAVEGQGQRRMEEVVRRNSGHNAAECKDSPLQHGAVGRRGG